MNLAQGILNGDRRAVARAISLVEDGQPQAADLLTALYPHTGRAHIVGITGTTGTGKSTLIDQVARLYRQQGTRVGILAIDPTSPFSGGALLGDRIRMQDLAGDPGVFIRSMATRGAWGGLSAATYDAAQILDAAGYGVILIETVGVGQDEVEIARLAHTVVVVDAPGLGDDVQAIKAGLTEIADIFVVNKADRPGADQTVHALELMLEMNNRQVGWRPPVCQTVAMEGTGIPDLVYNIQEHLSYLSNSGKQQDKAGERARVWLEWALRQELLARFLTRLEPGQWENLLNCIAAHELSPYAALQELLSCLPTCLPSRFVERVIMDSIFFKRQSKRAYLDKPVPQDALDRIIEKTRWAPSCSNNQPWRFIIVREPEALARFHEGLTRGNAWAKKAPILIALAAREADDYTRKDDPAVKYYLFGCGLAVENLLLAAVEEGLMGHPMAGYNAAKVKGALGIPEEYNVICVISLGYQGSIEDLDAETRAKDEKPRTRKEVSETFFFDGWPH